MRYQSLSLVCFALVVLVGCSGPQDIGEQDTAAFNDSPPGTAATLESQNVVAFTPEELQGAFNNGPERFVAEYRRKVLEVTGTVGGFGYYSISDNGYLMLNGFKFECDDQQPVAKALPSQLATLRGACGEYGVETWKVIGATGDEPETLTAEEYAAALAADPRLARERFNDKYVIITGRIAKVEDEGNHIYVESAEGQPGVDCYFASSTPREAKRNRSFEVGQQVRILGMALPEDLYLSDSLSLLEVDQGGAADSGN